MVQHRPSALFDRFHDSSLAFFASPHFPTISLHFLTVYVFSHLPPGIISFLLRICANTTRKKKSVRAGEGRGEGDQEHIGAIRSIRERNRAFDQRGARVGCFNQERSGAYRSDQEHIGAIRSMRERNRAFDQRGPRVACFDQERSGACRSEI